MALTSIQFPFRDALVEMNDPVRLGLATKRFQDWGLAVQTALPSYLPIVVTDFGAGGSGRADDTAALQQAINQAIANGGATILLPPGTYSIGTVTIPAGSAPVTILGAGESTILKRRAVLADGVGMLDIRGSHITLDSLIIDGDVTSPTPLLYNGGFSTAMGLNDPMAPSLTRNSSVWVHGPCTNFRCRNVVFRHSGGYAPLIDAFTGGIEDVEFVGCRWENNRPHLFGTVAGQELYGAWTGNLYVNADGRAANPGRVLKRLVVVQCKFLRNASNCIWSHLYGLDELNEEFTIIGNTFLDIGLDAILIGGVIGGAVVGNSGRRIGYVCTGDTGQSTPRWLPNLNATAIDSSGLVKSVLFVGNSFVSVNGGCADLDGHGLSQIGSNSFRIPYANEPEWEEDQISITGPTNSGSASYGVNGSNSSQTPYGATALTITGNIFINLRAGSIRLFAARRCLVSGNNILAPSDSIYPPIGIGPVGSGPYQRCYDNRIFGNNIDYNVAGPAIIEDDTYSAFLPAEKNTICGNVPLTPDGTAATEFLKSPTSSSVHYLEQPWFV